MEKTKIIRAHLNIGRLEAISFLLLLGIAMPMKYMMDIPDAVAIVGWIHGILFMAYFFVSMILYISGYIHLSDWGLCVLAALLPFGPFVLERRLRRKLGA